MRSPSIKSSPRVKSGRQYAAEHSLPAPRDLNSPRDTTRVFRKNPGPTLRHFVQVRHVRAFVEILPDWTTLSAGLNAILLAPPPRPGVDGFHRPGLVAICAQPRNPHWVVTDERYVDAHRDLFDRLGVPIESTPDGHALRFTEQTLRAYQLLHVLLHELGHHHDRMTTRSKREASRGEPFAELYARSHGDRIWARYFDLFPD
ncbi:MAG: hypothetical protein JWO31_169 [Phycisphaerales bacterium]|nr:hypothetical protein [Phycisphaerales bacterium]